MRRIAVITALASSLLFACEKPRERACRSLTLQAKDAEAVRTANVGDARVAAYRAQSAARWLRSNAVEDPALKNDAEELAAALDRLAEARRRLDAQAEALGAADVTDLVARAEKIAAYENEFAKVRSRCPGLDDVPLGQQADQCAMRLANQGDESMQPWAKWADSLPRRPLNETYARARDVHTAIVDRGRAESDIARLVEAIGAKCGS